MTGLGAMACFMVSFVLILEQVGPGHAVLVGIGEAGVIVGQPRPSRGLLRDCKSSRNLRQSLFQALAACANDQL